MATSLFALQEIVEGIKKENFHKRKVLLSKIMSYKLKVYPFLPVECVASAFRLDVSNFLEILYAKDMLVKKVSMEIRADDYWDYHNKLLSIVGVNEAELKEYTSEFELKNKRTITEIIEQEKKV